MNQKLRLVLISVLIALAAAWVLILAYAVYGWKKGKPR